MDLQLSGTTALLTGGASGIGLATARMMAGEGCRLVLWDRSDHLPAAADSLREDGFDVTTRQVDITDAAEVAAAADEAAGEGFDHVVHAAAVGSGRFGFPFTNLTPDDWRATIEVNVLGTAHVAHAVAPHLVARGGGSLCLVASVAGQIGSQTDPPYSASKAANINFAQCLAKDLAPHDVRVNVVCPGMVQTPLNRSVWQAWSDAATDDERLDYETWAGQKIAAVVPLGRWQQVDDIAAMITFLASPRASEVTGQTINVDGGFVMHW